jgi:hypothetical protein
VRSEIVPLLQPLGLIQMALSWHSPHAEGCEMVNERNDGEKRSRFFTFFTTLPGLLTAIAAVLSAATGLILGINKLYQGDGDSSKTGVVELPDSVGPSALIYHSGQLTVHSGDGVNLDAGIVTNDWTGNDNDWAVPYPPDPTGNFRQGSARASPRLTDSLPPAAKLAGAHWVAVGTIRMP